MIMGERKIQVNPLRWEQVSINLPTPPDNYLPLPWLYKIRGEGGINPDILIYVDGVIVTGGSFDHCWVAASWFEERINYLGIQDPPRKRNNTNRGQGPW